MKRVLFFAVLLWGLNIEATDSVLTFLQAVEQLHKEHGKHLSELKADLILGPVLDVGRDAEGWNLSENPCETALLGEAMRRGWEQGGPFLVAPKHFPGLGAREVDTHDHLEILNITPTDPEIIPFRYSVKQGAKALLLGHGIYPAFEKNPEKAVPAGFSSSVIGFLRDPKKGLGFHGLVIVDDVLMGAVTHFYQKEGWNSPDVSLFSATRVKESIWAGADLVMVFYWRENKKIVEETLRVFEEGIQKDKSLSKKLDDAVLRILQAKREFFSGLTVFAQSDAEILKRMDLREKISQILFLWHSEDPNENPVEGIGAYRFPSHRSRKEWFNQNRHEVKVKSIIPTFVAIDQRKGYSPHFKKTLVQPILLGAALKEILGNRDACKYLLNT